jgi:hypothetical protein
MTVLAPTTKPGIPRLSEIARKAVAPTGITATGWPAVSHTSRVKLGVTYDPWQHAAGRLILAKRANGRLAAMIDGVGMSVCRQVGKTYLVGGTTFSLCVDRPKLLVIWSSHHARTHGETFLAMQGFAERTRVRPYIDRVFLGSGDEEIRFVNGSRILFGARERGFGRGIPGVDMIVSDEAQIMSDKALDAQLATMNTSPFGLGLFIGTPPRPDDPSEAFTRMRDDAWAGRLTDGAWIELSADPGSDPSDRKQWAKANPSYPDRTPVESFLRLQRKLKPDSFLREGLGLWDEPVDEEAPWRLTLEEWELTEQQVPKPAGIPVFFITMAKELRSATIAAAAQGADLPHVELADHRPGTSWLTSRAKELNERHPGAVFAAYHAGPVKAWVPDLAREGIELQLLTQPQAAAAYANLKRVVESKEFTHSADETVNESIIGMERRELDAGAWVIDWKASTGNPAPIAAEMGALWLQELMPSYDVLDSVR